MARRAFRNACVAGCVLPLALSLALSLVLTLVLTLVALPGCGKQAGPPGMENKAGEEAWPKIEELIYPTLGYPQLAPAGQEFILEFDFSCDTPDAAQPSGIGNWRANISASNSFAPYTTSLEVGEARFAPSRRWPEDSGRQVYDTWQVNVRVPDGVPADLYDLEVRVDAGDREVFDYQPNCLSVTGAARQDYEVVQITDAHVADVEYPGYSTHDRQVHEALYLRKAVAQINLVDPDFVVFSGDLVFGQKYMPEDWPPDDAHAGATSEYAYEYPWAYREMLALDVPCFYVPGNHDTYNDTVKDGVEWWTESLGPLHYSFDYGDTHYTMIDTTDWSREDRTLEKGPFYGFVNVLQPGRWQGQARSGGDRFEDGQAPDPQQYGGQLAWIRDDLAAGQGAGSRIAFSHHDPAQPGCWDDADYAGYRVGGRGEGRLALLRLCADFDVSMLASGHEHHDHITELPWSDGGGSTLFANTTCLETESGLGTSYPGYRLYEINGGGVFSYNYADPKWSYPYYRGIQPGAENDLDSLWDPAIDYAFSNGGVWSKGDGEVSCAVANSLAKSFTGARLEFYMPFKDGGSYLVTGATGFTAAQIPDRPDWAEVFVYFDLPAEGGKEIRVSLR